MTPSKNWKAGYEKVGVQFKFVDEFDRAQLHNCLYCKELEGASVNIKTGSYDCEFCGRHIEGDDLIRELSGGNGNRKPPVEEKKTDTLEVKKSSKKKAKPKALLELLTDSGNAERMARLYGNRLRFVPKSSGWLIYTPANGWTFDESGEIVRLATATAKSMFKDAAAALDNDMAGALSDWAKSSLSRSKLDAAIELLKHQPDITIGPEKLDLDPMLLGVPNGVIDLRTGKFRRHRPEDLITKRTGVAYDPKATCPLFEKTLKEILITNPEIALYLKRVVGYWMTGLTKEQALWIWCGKGANGKTTLLDLVLAVLGDYGCPASGDTFMVKRGGISNDLAALHNVRLATCVELDDGKRLAEALVKQATGRDKIAARFLYKEHFSFYPQFKIVIAANYKPKITGRDLGIWRRIKVVPFDRTFTGLDDDKNLPEKLITEHQGILNWAIAGCLEWQEEGVGEPAIVTSETAAYRDEMDALSLFTQECCDVHPENEMKAGKGYEVYREWAKSNGEEVVSSKDFKGLMEQKGYPRKEKSFGNVYVGLDLKLAEFRPNLAQDENEEIARRDYE